MLNISVVNSVAGNALYFKGQENTRPILKYIVAKYTFKMYIFKININICRFENRKKGTYMRKYK